MKTEQQSFNGLFGLKNQNSVNSEIFARILYSRKALKDILAAFTLRD